MSIMNVLVINAGSSSLKYQLIDMDDESVIAKGLCERVGIEGGCIKHKSDKGNVTREMPMNDHIDAMRVLIDVLTDSEIGVIDDLSSIHAVGHRVVHGGEGFSESVLIDAGVMAAIRDNVRLAPLHNPANIQGIEACQKLMPSVPMVAVFDTAFHQTMPEHAYMYGLPYEYYTRLKVRRYGFHGTSHFFVSRRAAEMLGRPLEELKLITCHLGNGCSIAAVKNGACIDTSMGLTPLEGLVMGTRSGDIDPASIEFIMKEEGLTIEQMTSVLNKKSGVDGLGGVGSDMRDLTAAVAAGNKRAIMAQDVYCYRIKKYIGAYAAAMGGLDAVIFTAGVGENDDIVREKSVEGMEFLGLKIDKERNAGMRSETDLSAPGSTAKILLINTNEELVIARDAVRLSK
jgi:acetate kinase